ncbi:hypothetical protein G6F22_019021 [Rhizopus arrhizus]|nr:hypothetical protein G6F22_019021 [Rhizopus arrhizus]
MALCLGAIAGGGLMLVAQARWGWQAPFAIMAGSLARGAALTAFVKEDREPEVSTAAGNDRLALASITAYFRLDSTRCWLPMLAGWHPKAWPGWWAWQAAPSAR